MDNLGSILVSYSSSSLDKNDIIMYFQSRKHGGGDIKDVILIKDGAAVVQFEDKSCVQKVLNMEHVIKGVRVTVKQETQPSVGPKNIKQVYTKVSAKIEPQFLDLTGKDLHETLQSVQKHTGIKYIEGSDGSFVVSGSYQQVVECHDYVCSSLSQNKDRVITSHGNNINKEKLLSKNPPTLHTPTSKDVISFSEENIQNPIRTPKIKEREIEVDEQEWVLFSKVNKKWIEEWKKTHHVVLDPVGSTCKLLIKPTEGCTQEILDTATELILERFVTKGRNIKSIRFRLEDSSTSQQSKLRKAVLTINKQGEAVIERATDRQSWDVFGTPGKVDKVLEHLKGIGKVNIIDSESVNNDGTDQEELTNSDENGATYFPGTKYRPNDEQHGNDANQLKSLQEFSYKGFPDYSSLDGMRYNGLPSKKQSEVKQQKGSSSSEIRGHSNGIDQGMRGKVSSSSEIRGHSNGIDQGMRGKVSSSSEIRGHSNGIDQGMQGKVLSSSEIRGHSNGIDQGMRGKVSSLSEIRDHSNGIDKAMRGKGMNGHGGARPKQKRQDNGKCPICLSSLTHPKTLPNCKHTFCKRCLDEALKVTPKCPLCREPHTMQASRSNFPERLMYDTPDDMGPIYSEGSAPIAGKPTGTMKHRIQQFSLPGYEDCGTITIEYSLRSGIQGPEHPNPGQMYDSTFRTAYLPDNHQGRDVMKMLRKAFNLGLLFKVGRSMTSGFDNQIIWGDIPHKTNIQGGPSRYGYPDPTYLADVKDMLARALQMTSDEFS